MKVGKVIFNNTELGKSLQILSFDKNIQTDILYNNNGFQKAGLSQLYNLYINDKYKDEIVLFIHDDINICDLFLSTQLNAAMKEFDIVGIVGNQECRKAEVKWTSWYDENKGTIEHQCYEKLSGTIKSP